MPDAAVTIIGTVVTALTGAIGYLWRRQVNTEDRTREKLEECEKSHIATQQQFAALNAETGFLRGKMEVLLKRE